MKKIFIFIMLYMLTGCTAPDNSTENQPTSYVQDFEQLHIDKNYSPVNYNSPVGMWFPYMDYAHYMYNKSGEEFRESVREKFISAKENSVNTLFIHMIPDGSAYYESEIFPPGDYLAGDYDPLEIMLQEGHSLGLSVHAWINPLRCQTVSQMQNMPDDFIVKQWAYAPDCNFTNIVNERYYLNPAYDETINLICSGIEEIINNYNVDGIHIDDYFYPTTETFFDSVAFSESKAENLSAWRMENINNLVRRIYSTVNDKGLIFGISPQGNITADYETQYADVKLWGSASGYCDYIVPQIYYGFNNETCPFMQTLAEWESIVTNPDIKLIIGLGAYKLGTADKWAGVSGENEWLENPDIINQQIRAVTDSTADGYALYY